MLGKRCTTRYSKREPVVMDARWDTSLATLGSKLVCVVSDSPFCGKLQVSDLYPQAFREQKG